MMSFKTPPILIFVFLIFIGCQDVDSPQKPDNLIPAKEMEEIMYESILLTAAKGHNSGLMSKTSINPETFVLEKFNIDSVIFAQNMGYYATDLTNFIEMNSNVSKRITILHKDSDSLNKIARARQDSIRKCEIERGENVLTLDTLNASRIQKAKELKNSIEINPLKPVKDSLSKRPAAVKKRKKKNDSL